MRSQEEQQGTPSPLVRVTRAYSHLGWHLVFAPVITWTALYLKGYSTPSAIWAWTEQRPIFAISAVVMAIAASYPASVVFAHVRPKIARFLAYGAIVRGCGVEDYHPRTTSPKIREWARFVAIARRQDLGTVRILCFTGAQTFARESAPLHELLEFHQGDVEILLVAQGSRAYRQRIHELAGDGSVNREKYEKRCRDFEKELEDTKRFCLHLAKKPATGLRSIEVRAYEMPAVWKMAFVGGYLWLQHYEPLNDIELSPAYIVKSGDDGAMYRGLDRVFLNRWLLSGHQVTADNSGLLLRRDSACSWSGAWAENQQGLIRRSPMQFPINDSDPGLAAPN